MVMLSRLANKPIAIPKGVTVNISANQLEIKGSKKTIKMTIDKHLQISSENNTLSLSVGDIGQQKKLNASKLASHIKKQSGTIYALLEANLSGANEEFKIELTLVGVGYRAQVQGNKINLTLGFSHPVVHVLPEGVRAETPSQTELVLFSSDKQLVGQQAAKIRRLRATEPYKGKGVRFKGEVVVLKETKKK